MSDELDRLKHSKRLLKDENAIAKQKKIAQLHGGFDENKAHGFSKTHAMTCGDSNCVMCGNPRKFFDEPTIQEKRLHQNVDEVRDRHSNGLPISDLSIDKDDPAN
jgi:hypothetical protein